MKAVLLRCILRFLLRGGSRGLSRIAWRRGNEREVIFKHIFGNAVISKVAHCYLSERWWSSGPPIEYIF